MRLQPYFYGYGAFTLLGGVMGYLMAHSEASLLAGCLTGSVIILATYLRPKFPAVSFIGLTIASLLLLIKFGPDFVNTGKLMPAGLMAGLSLLSLALLVVRVIRGNVRPG